jgi:hypothetical protein
MKNRIANTLGVSWCKVDCRVSRQLAAATELAGELKRKGELGSIVVFATSTNWFFEYDKAKHARDVVGSDRYVIFVSGYNRGYTYPNISNKAMKQLAKNDKKVFVADWNKLIRTKGGAGISDGRCHLTSSGARWYVDEIVKTIRKVRVAKLNIARKHYNKHLSPLSASSSVTLAVGGKAVAPLDARSASTRAGRTYKWSSSDSDVVKVDSKGKMTAVSVGKATVTLKEVRPTPREKKIVVRVVEDKKRATSISLSAKRIYKWIYLIKVRSDSGTVTGIPIFRSSNTKVASVNRAGIVIGKKAGTAKIKVSYGSKTKYITIKVK